MTMVSYGVEVSILEILKLRAGHYSESQRDSSPVDTRSDVTYGVGLSLPLHAYLPNRLPLTLLIDIADKEHERFSELYSSGIGDFREFTIGIHYNRSRVSR